MTPQTLRLVLGLALAVALFAESDPPSEEELKHSAELLQVISTGDLHALKSLVEEKNLNINARDKYERTPLHHASQQGKPETVQYLLEKGADVWKANKWGTNALHMASSGGRLEVVKVMSRWGVFLDQPAQNGMTALLYAIQRKQHEVADFLLNEGTDLEARTTSGMSALHIAVGTRSIDMVRWVLEKADPSQLQARNRFGETPLHSAVKTGLKDITMLLAQQGNLQFNDESDNALFMSSAVRGGNVDLLRFFLERKLPLDFKDPEGNNALHIVAMSYGKKAMVDFLFASGLDNQINDTNHDGKVPLHYAILYMNKEGLSALLRAGADLGSAGTFDDLPPLHYAVKRRRPQVVRLLANHKSIDLNLKDKDGKTALDHAKAVLGEKHSHYQRLGKEMVAILEKASKPNSSK